jgi:hypothetical protein
MLSLSDKGDVVTSNQSVCASQICRSAPVSCLMHSACVQAVPLSLHAIHVCSLSIWVLSSH